MSFKRFYSSGAPVGSWISLTAEAQKHARVVRLREGEKIELIDGKGNFWQGVYQNNGVQIQTVGQAPSPSPYLTLAIGVTQGGTFDDIVRQAVEMGVNEIVPLRCYAGAVGIDNKRAEGKADRWQRIIEEACKQSGQYWQTKLQPITEIKTAIERLKSSYNIVASLQKEKAPWCDIKVNKGQPVTVWVGPEGDFSPSEYTLLQNIGTKPVSLGNTVLRVETAAVALVASVKAHL